MLKKILLSFSLAIHNIRSRLLHTLLSVLGIVIGVAALVSILSLIDGMEKYATDQISKTSSLNSVVVQSEIFKEVNKVWVRKDNYQYLKYEDFTALQNHISSPIYGLMYRKSPKEIFVAGKDEGIGSNVFWIAVTDEAKAKLIHGQHPSAEDITTKKKLTIINRALASVVTGDSLFQNALEKEIFVGEDTLKIIGVLEENNSTVSEAFLPFSLINESDLKEEPAIIEFAAAHVDEVPLLKNKIKEWIDKNHLSDDLKVITNDFRLKQAAEGFLLFRLVMGMIVGISVIVGGIGVMNVLLISVTERTVEIGIRKAMGAKKRDILFQFLSESITIATFGSLLGVLFGITSTFIFVPIIKSFTNVPFHAAFTMNTLLIIAVVAVLIGIIFGTYPAMKAAKLDPVEAMRRE